MVYSLLVLHPRARAYFKSPAQFETFITFLAAGARWKVLAGCAVVGGSGGALLLLRHGAPTTWQSYMFAKAALFLIALGIFAYASWFAWPARVMASPSEAPVFQRRFRVIAISLVALVGLSFLLSALARTQF